MHVEPICFVGDEALTILMEECGEVIQVASKIQRFGDREHYDNLSKEIGDIMCMIDILVEQGVVDINLALHSKENKRKKLKNYSSLEL